MSPRLSPRTRDRGATAVEYALIVFLVAIAMLAGVVLLTRSLSAAYAASADRASGPVSTASQTSSAPTQTGDDDGDDGGDGHDDGDSDDNGNQGNGNGNGNVVLAKPGAPSAPAAVVKASAKGTVDLTWSEPSSNGGAAVRGYLVEKSTDGTTWSTVTSDTGSSASSHSASALGDGTGYYFRVAAINAMGTGAYSPASAKVTTPDVPATPGAPSGTVAGQGGITLTWSAPNGNGSAITGYRVERSTTGTSGWADVTANTGSTATTYAVTGLSDATDYYFRVSAINVVGQGGASAASAKVTTAGRPDAPSAPTGSPAGKGVIDLAWTAGADNGAAITGYRIEMSPNGKNQWSKVVDDTGSPVTQYSVTALDNATDYYFRVYAINAVDVSAASGASAKVTTASTPGKPGKPSANRGNASVSLSWSAPSSDGGAAITGYRIDSRLGNGSWAQVTSNTGSTGTTYTVTGLTNGSSYTFRVYAINDVGTGSASDTSSSVTPSTR